MNEGFVWVIFMFAVLLSGISALNFIELRELRKRLHDAYLYSIADE